MKGVYARLRNEATLSLAHHLKHYELIRLSWIAESELIRALVKLVRPVAVCLSAEAKLQKATERVNALRVPEVAKPL